MYNNPYFMNMGMPGAQGLGSRLGLFRSIKGINWGNLLNNTQKTLGIINQAIPIAYQVKPIVNNAKTMFRVMGAVRDNPKDTKSVKTGFQTTSEARKNTQSQEKIVESNQPMFFI